LSGSPEDTGERQTGQFSHLPAEFEFGVSSSAFSIEGAASIDGRRPSVWDAVAAVPGRTVDGSTGVVAVDHYHRYADDVALLAQLGVDAYRFSISWSRVQPTGRGAANPCGLDFYDRLVDRLLSVGIDPWPTIYHWDLPLDLMLAGGWLERDTAAAAGDFAQVVTDRVGDRVRRWTTIADPLLHMAYGHALGVDAPGLTLLGHAFRATHHLLVAHANVRDVLSQDSSASVGISNHHTLVVPATGSAADRVAAALYDAYHNHQFSDPILTGRYPRLLEPLLDRQPDLVRDGDLAAIAGPLDFYGVSYFHPTVVEAAPDNATIPFAVVPSAGAQVTDTDWAVQPEALTRVLTDLRRRYPGIPPIIITENGAAYADARSAQATDADTGEAGGETRSHLPDQARIDYLRSHLGAVDDAAAAGVDIRGYFHRGLTDAWEGTEGFTRQFGLVRVEPGSLERIPRASFDFFGAVIREHRARRHTPDSSATHRAAPPSPPTVRP
jgi:beta-glucosidase